jgi:hypothetical protein
VSTIELIIKYYKSVSNTFLSLRILIIIVDVIGVVTIRVNVLQIRIIFMMKLEQIKLRKLLISFNLNFFFTSLIKETKD